MLMLEPVARAARFSLECYPQAVSSDSSATNCLQEHLGGDPTAIERLIPIVYKELRRIAAAQMRNERMDHTLQPTALANEALVRLIEVDGIAAEGRTAFLRIAAREMRRVLIDHARARNAEKRAGGLQPISQLEPVENPRGDPIDVLALDDALRRLERLSERQAQVVEFRFFGGLTLQEAAAAMGIGRETAKDHWTLARAWLNRELTRGLAP